MSVAGRSLGRRASRSDARTLRMARYLKGPTAHAAPPRRDWTDSAQAPTWRMFRNDEVGCCTCAAAGHMMQSWAALTGKSRTLLVDEILRAYAAVSGWDPARPGTDQGAQMLDVLRYWRSTGIAGEQIAAYVAIDLAPRYQLEAAVNLFGAAYVGADLPVAAQTQTVWDVAAPGKYDESYTPGSWGGHAMAMLGYDRLHVQLVTWGAVKIATWEWVRTYVSEAWAVLDDLWVDSDQLSPSGFDVVALVDDLARLQVPSSI